MKNLYSIDEIDKIFQNCNTLDELLAVCAVLKMTREDGQMSDNVSKVVVKFSLLRYTELTSKI